MTFLILLLFSFSSIASTVYFGDSCTQKEIKVGTPNGTSLFLRLNKLDPDEDLQIEIRYQPSSIEKLHSSQKMTFRYRIPSGQISLNGRWQGQFNLPKTKWMRSVERELFDYRIWDAEVVWYQSNKANSKVATFYHPIKQQAYYEIISKGLCSWEGRPSVDSKLYENLNNETMKVSRVATESVEELNEGGISFGYGENALSHSKVGFLSDSNFGWIFTEWQKQIGHNKYISISRDYYLSKGESGVFYLRPSFTRYQAKKYSWVKYRNGCGSFEPVSEGYVDIAKSFEDFMVVPSTYYGRENLLEFIEVVRPAINTCKSFSIKNEIDAQDIFTTGNDELVYFYELGSL